MWSEFDDTKTSVCFQQSVSSVTSKLKRLILNQRVLVTIRPPLIKEFYSVDVKLSNQRSVNQLLLSNDPIPVVWFLLFTQSFDEFFFFDLDYTTGQTCGVRNFSGNFI